MNMRGGFDSALARVDSVFAAAHPHTAYLFAYKRGTRIKVLVYDIHEMCRFALFFVAYY
jgi:hypothetical protein